MSGDPFLITHGSATAQDVQLKHASVNAVRLSHGCRLRYIDANE